MDSIFELAIVTAWIWLMVVSLIRVSSERRRWDRQHTSDAGTGKLGESACCR